MLPMHVAVPPFVQVLLEGSRVKGVRPPALPRCWRPIDPKIFGLQISVPHRVVLDVGCSPGPELVCLVERLPSPFGFEFRC